MPSLLPVPYPGPDPGPARARLSPDRITLSNRVLTWTWSVRGTRLRPARWTDHSRRAALDQDGCALFRLATRPPRPVDRERVFVAIRLDPDAVRVRASLDGDAWTELAAFPRAQFPGAPRLVRLGKMNLRAEAKSHARDGEPGEAVIDRLRPAPLPDAPLVLRAAPHEARTAEHPFPDGAGEVVARIAKGTDRGMSWAPALALVWDEGTRFVLVGVRDKPATFNVTTAAGERIVGADLAPAPDFDLSSDAFRLVGAPRLVRDPRHPGVAVEADLAGPRGIRARWRAELRDHAGYVRQRLTLTAAAPVPLHAVALADLRLPHPRVVGTVPGCPVEAGGRYVGVEMPGARAFVDPDRVRIGFDCALTLAPDSPVDVGAVSGIAPPGQLRRAFLHYVEAERARPSVPFLHVNTWYDLGFGVSEEGLVDVARRFHDALTVRRGVAVRAYLVDDGWDDPSAGLWTEDRRKFPDGLAGTARRLREFEGRLGVWISPLGGYGGDRERTAQARRRGLIPPDGALDLAHPGYRRWFEAKCLSLMREAGVNAFKWDRAGSGVTPHFLALLQIARSLRRADPQVFVNVTVGTWPSPFWLAHVDCTWRDGSADVGWSGKGRGPSPYDRERWITFRDGECRRRFVDASPLYPLNSVMHHGVVHGREFQGGDIGRANPPELRGEARTYFASGATLQELYLTPAAMTEAAWDAVAEAARWAQRNAAVLVDAHWVGGDPLRGEPYGYAAWNRGRGTLAVRNPDDAPRAIALDPTDVFELPPDAPRRWRLESPYADQRVRRLDLTAGTAQRVVLEPFEVLVFDAAPG